MKKPLHIQAAPILLCAHRVVGNSRGNRLEQHKFLCPGLHGCPRLFSCSRLLSYSYSFLRGRVSVRRKRWLTVLTHKYERKTVLGKDLLLLNLGTPCNFSGPSGAQQCLWSPGIPIKVWVLTVSSKAGLRLHISNKVLLGNAYVPVQGPHCVTRAGHTLRPLEELVKHTDDPTPQYLN